MDTTGDTAGDITGTGAGIEDDDGGGVSAAWDLPTETRAAAAARALTAGALRGWRVADPGDVDDIVLMVDELVANAVLHGAGPIRLRLRLHGRRLVGEVADARPTGPPPPPDGVPVWDEAGRGLLLIAALSTDHGTRAARPDAPGGGTGGKTVWFSRLLTPGDGHRPASARNGGAPG